MKALLELATRAGVSLTAKGDKLLVQGPDEALKPDLIDELRKHKDELLQALADDRNQEWHFQIMYVGQDPWMMGTRLDKPGHYICWYVREVTRQ